MRSCLNGPYGPYIKYNGPYSGPYAVPTVPTKNKENIPFLSTVLATT